MNMEFTHAEKILEFDQIKQMLAEEAAAPGAKERLLSLAPMLEERACRLAMEETTEARHIVEHCGTPPITAMDKLEEILALSAAGAMLLPYQLWQVASFLISCRRLVQYLQRAEEVSPHIAAYGGSFYPLEELEGEIHRCIGTDRVLETASPQLRELGRKKELLVQQMQGKLATILQGKKNWFSDGGVVQRNGTFVLPVKKAYKNQLSGTVMGVSGSGGTYFIEPAAVGKLRDEINALEVEIENETRRILYTLSAMVDAYGRELRLNREAMETLDFLFAKGKLSLRLGGRAVPVTADRRLVIKGGRHPLLPKEKCVPLQFEMGDGYRGVIITGPNTGGKTVALKTVGLLSMMAQCGLHIPAEEGTTLCMHSRYLCDIGDGQSISENLSTFSAHMKRIINVLDAVDADSLVLLDELGSGTDPAEGMGIAIAVLEELSSRGCLYLVTTHYPEVKQFAERAPQVCNARMAFDEGTLAPLYRLELGRSGESCALQIAKRLGLPPALLARAKAAAYGEVADNTPAHPLPEADIVRPEQAKVPVNTDASIGSTGAKKSPAIRREKNRGLPSRALRFAMGDSVAVGPAEEKGIVYRPADERGELVVQVKGRKRIVPYKQVKLLVPAAELYPPDYDFSILFDTVENRKARHQMGKRARPDLEIQLEDPSTWER